MLGTFLLGITHGKLWPSYSDHYEFNLDPGVYFLSWMAKEMRQLPHLLLHSHWHAQRNGGGGSGHTQLLP